MLYSLYKFNTNLDVKDFKFANIPSVNALLNMEQFQETVL